MIALFKARCREARRDTNNITATSGSRGHPQLSSIPVGPESGKSHVTNRDNLPLKFRRKILSSYNTPRPCPSDPGSSSCIASSSTTAVDGNSAMVVKESLKATSHQKSKSTAGADTALSNTHIIQSYSHYPITTQIIPCSSSPRSGQNTLVNTGVKLECITIPTTPPITDQATGSKPSDATGSSVPSSSSNPSPIFPSSSSSATSTEHSSYSDTQKSDSNAAKVDEVPNRNDNRTRHSRKNKNGKRGDVQSLRPLGPIHLEYDYTVAHRELSTAVAKAAYELFRFSTPVRDDTMEARRPTKESIPALRNHRLVQQAAKEVDEADSLLEAALARGETLYNTPVPEKWRWGSDCLQEYGWAYLEPEIGLGRRIVSMKAPYDPSAELSVPRTRGRKRKEREDEAHGNGESEQLEESLEADDAPLRTTPSGATPPRESSSMPDSFSADSSKKPPQEKRRPGRPRKKAPETFEASDNVETAVETKASPVPASFPSVIEAGPPAEGEPPVEPPVKRKRGRPRKNPIEAVPTPTVPSKRSAATTAAAPEPERRSKRIRTGSSGINSSR